MAGYGAGLMCEYRHDDPEMNEKDPLIKKIKQPRNRLLCFN